MSRMTLSPTDILNTLQTKRPVSIIRAGDGEKIVLESNKDIPSYRLCIESVMKRQVGYEPTMSEVEAIRQNLITAYNGADIVGIPMHERLKDMNKHWRNVEEVVKPHCSTTKFTSTDVAYDMLYTEMFEQWLTNKRDVVYISCRNIDAELKEHFSIKNIHSYIIAPEMKFTSTYDDSKHHYPEQFNEIEWWLNNAPCEGSPCLVGAGVIGKIYCNWMRDRGGLAFDIGAVFDLWAGYATRGPERGLDKQYEKYKL